ncbi:MAG: putative metal-binding motif-containing protein, partial [Myxococcota bacterium]
MAHRTTSLALLSVLSACAGGSNSSITVIERPPDLTIISPPDGTEFDEGQIVNFQARVDDDTDPSDTLELIWSSDVDGELLSTGTAASDGTVEFATANLSPGFTHTVSLRATDSDALDNTYSISIVIIDLPDAPEIQVLQPVGGQNGVEGEEFEFRAVVSDATEPSESLSVVFESDQPDGVFCTPQPGPTGEVSCVYALSPAVHQLTFTVEDGQGYVGSATAYFTVIPLTQIDDDNDGWDEEEGDCDDANPQINPGADEVENGLDDDCDGTIDEGTNAY